MAADLMAGNADVRPVAAGCWPGVGRDTGPHPGIRQQAGTLRVRADAGYFTAELATEAVAAGARFRDRSQTQHRDVAGLCRDRPGPLGGCDRYARRPGRRV